MNICKIDWVLASFILVVEDILICIDIHFCEFHSNSSTDILLTVQSKKNKTD